MIITRVINGIEIDVEVTEGNGIYFEEDQIADLKAFDVESIKNFLYSRNSEYSPYSVIWEITNRCNFGCKFCYINCSGMRPGEYLSVNDCKKIIDGLVDAGMLFCTLTGGECLLHPGFSDIYTYLKQKGVLVSIFTNASLINESLFQLFKNYPPYKIEVSIYALSARCFEQVTGLHSALYNTVLDNILRLSSMGIQVICKTPLNILTETETPRIKEWCTVNGIPFYNSPELLTSYTGESMDKYSVSQDILNDYKDRRFSHLANTTSLTFGHKYAFECPGGQTNAFISYDMKIHPCSAAYGIRALSVSLAENDVGSALALMRAIVTARKGTRLPECAGCNYADICNRCIVDNYKQRTNWETSCREFQEAIHSRLL